MNDRHRNSTGSPRAPTSPSVSPMNRHGQAGSAAAFNMRRGPNNATKAAAQRLAQVMSHSTDEDDEENDLALDYAAISEGGGIGLGGTGRAAPARASMAARPIQEQPTSTRTRVPVAAPARPRSPMNNKLHPQKPYQAVDHLSQL